MNMEKDKRSCCDNCGKCQGDSANNGQQGAATEGYDNVDINEWAGKCEMRPFTLHAKLYLGSFKIFAVKK
jgi:hypothetical protein